MTQLNNLIKEYLEDEYGLNCKIEFENTSVESIIFIVGKTKKFKYIYSLKEPNENCFAPKEYLLYCRIETVPLTSSVGHAMACNLHNWKEKLDEDIKNNSYTKILINKKTRQIKLF